MKHCPLSAESLACYCADMMTPIDNDADQRIVQLARLLLESIEESPDSLEPEKPSSRQSDSRQ
jgi:hypothetical protein